ncbi:CRISPR-associated endonuclease Cas2 [Sporohalobacter salinus]|uniref:CRISPR-associated endonuclease Cas2 n=1 Tax=Sporohalobacter salinus TaxID=1494606 RepID=UPI00195F7F95|nr:CRISPR-associated endonuclease Cas2 [Sporohalobacter salinus]MBM7623751.1 CRISPR-associated protein Cas2 [Sporohalobacter salinus]
MFVILTYDVGVDRVNKIRKLLKKYLTWTQNSVFEGEITKGKLDKCLSEVEKIVDKNHDSIYIYTIRSTKFISKNILGNEKSFDELFL